MTYWDAATLPAVFCTAYHCLITVAKMKKTDKVLIHTGSGGVGLAAIQLAKQVGAEIITTAGNPRKRAYLRSLGIQHVFPSRDTSYEQGILAVTNGQGVDIVLNSITGPGMKEATLRATAKNARFVEMSKLSVWTPEEVKELRPDVGYSVVDLSAIDHASCEKLLEVTTTYLDNGMLKAIPFVKFDALRIRQALHYLQKASHIGKVVITMPEVIPLQGHYKTEVPLFSAESTYLITGGLGGIGFEVCKWMLRLGATDILLTGRNPPNTEIAEHIKRLNEKGFNISVKLGDIGNMKHCCFLVKEVANKMKPLRGVMHCAGVLRDNLYTNQTWDAFQATFNPKVQGTWNLHDLTKDLLLEHFVVYSSVTALIGTPGQPNHAAANCFEDAFIQYRHSMGLPGLSINWGQWAQVGCAKELNLPSLLPLSVQRMLNGLELAMRTEKKQLSFVEFSSVKNLSSICPLINYAFDERVLKHYDTATNQSGPDLKADKFWEEMDQANIKTQKVEVLSKYLKIIARSALRLDSNEKLSETADLQELGLDSLMIIELKNSIQSLIGSRLNVTASMLKNCNTIQLISGMIVTKLMEEADQQQDFPIEPLESAEMMELLTKDAQLSEEVHIAPGTEPAVKPNEIKTLLITGATGQLGPFILTEICNEYKYVDKVYCLVKNTLNDSVAKAKLKAHLKGLELEEDVNWEKIEGLSGNVALENLGVSQKKYAELCKSVDGIIHLAAKTNASEHLRPQKENGNKTDCRSVNIGGTVNILKFACSGKIKHLFYPSTLLSGVLGENHEDRLPDNWPEAGVIQTIVHQKIPGLQTSKWICEMLLEQANHRGIPCKVFRFPWIAGNSRTGQVNVLNNTYIQRFLGFLKMEAIPDLVIPAVLLPVDMCAKVALMLFVNDSTPNEIFNVTHSKPDIEQEFVNIASDEFGKTLKIMSWKSFLEQIEARKEETQEVQELYSSLKQMSRYFADAAEFVTKYNLAPDTYFANPKVSRFIPNYGAEFPSTMQTVAKDLKYVKSTGLFEKIVI